MTDPRPTPGPRYHDYYAEDSRADLEFRLVFRLVRTSRLWTKLIDELLRTRAEQTRVQWEAMFAIAISDGPVIVRDIADRLGLRWPTLVRVFEELAREELIERRANPQDGRSRLIELTPAGQEAVATSRELVDARRHDVFEALSDDELKLCSELLDRVLEVLSDEKR